jgi:penicillin amidase
VIDAIGPWTGQTDVDERAVALVDAMRRRFRRTVQREVLAAAIAAREPGLDRNERLARADRLGRLPALDERFLQIAEAKPAHLLPSNERSWGSFIERLAIEAAAECAGRDGFLRWGKANTSSFGHPLASALPLLANKFGLPTHEQPGHPTCVRVASPQFGASDRMVIRAGSEAHALIQTPAGQSSDPQSPHYSDLHPTWRDGRPLPLAPGVPVERIAFAPAAP